MRQKRYFDKFTIIYTVFFIVLGIIIMLGKLSKKLLAEADLLIPNAQQKVITTTDIMEQVALGIITVLVLYAAFCFYRFMRTANRGQLFSGLSQSLWKQISTVFITIGGIAALLCIIDFKYVGIIPLGGLISSIAYSFSKIFKDAHLLKNENDLTV